MCLDVAVAWFTHGPGSSWQIITVGVSLPHCWSAEGEAVHQDISMEPQEDNDGRTFVEVISEKYSQDNFPCRRGPGMGVVVVPTAGPQGSPLKGERGRKITGFVKLTDKYGYVTFKWSLTTKYTSHLLLNTFKLLTYESGQTWI